MAHTQRIFRKDVPRNKNQESRNKVIPDIIVGKIKKNAGKRKIAAYGWSEKTSDELRLKGIDIEKCFTGNKNLLEQDKKSFLLI